MGYARNEASESNTDKVPQVREVPFYPYPYPYSPEVYTRSFGYPPYLLYDDGYGNKVTLQELKELSRRGRLYVPPVDPEPCRHMYRPAANLNLERTLAYASLDDFISYAKLRSWALEVSGENMEWLSEQEPRNRLRQDDEEWRESLRKSFQDIIRDIAQLQQELADIIARTDPIDPDQWKVTPEIEAIIEDFRQHKDKMCPLLSRCMNLRREAGNYGMSPDHERRYANNVLFRIAVRACGDWMWQPRPRNLYGRNRKY
ncbi:hypothetical protein F5Y04DRAFT_280011 [Hypomontagnella monticulosa]|nr:hypothetical protein F5Y04DRAFT_280011 [Hypomontagnella monticulosa]